MSIGMAMGIPFWSVLRIAGRPADTDQIIQWLDNYEGPIDEWTDKVAVPLASPESVGVSVLNFAAGGSITAPSVIGTDTLTNTGTATLTAGAGTITVGIGTVGLVSQNGTPLYNCDNTTKLYDLQGINNDGTPTGGVLSTADGIQDYLHEYGYNKWVVDGEPELLSNIQTTLDRLATIKGGGSDSVNMVLVGDSWTQKTARWTQKFTDDMQSIFGNAGAGYGSFGGNSQSDYTGFASDTNAVVVRTGAWTVETGGNSSPDTTSITSVTAGNVVTVTNNGTVVEARQFHYRQQSGGGDFRWRIDGGTWTTVNTVGAEAYIVLNFGFSGSITTLEIETLDTNPVELYGVCFRTGSIDGVNCHAIGLSGGMAESFNNVPSTSDWITGVTDLGNKPDMFIVGFGTNEQQNTRTPAQYKTELTELVQRFRTINASADVLIWCPAKNKNQDTLTPMEDYAVVAREVAVSESCAYANSIDWFADDYNKYSYTSNRPLFDSSGIHPDLVYGGEVLNQMMLSVFGEEDQYEDLYIPNDISGNVLVGLFIAPAIYKEIGSVHGSRDRGYTFNGSPAGRRQTDVWFANNAPNYWHDGVGYLVRYYADELAHNNGSRSRYIKWKEDDGTAGLCCGEEDTQYPMDWSPDPSGYQRNLRYFTTCAGVAGPQVPWMVLDGQGGETPWLDVNGKVLLLNPTP
jgi:hypothetical protein